MYLGCIVAVPVFAAVFFTTLLADGVADRMVEVGTDGLGTLSCTIYTDAYYTTQKSIDSVKAGDTIYWTTSAGNGWNKKTWHHVGTVFATMM